MGFELTPSLFRQINGACWRESLKGLKQVPYTTLLHDVHLWATTSLFVIILLY